jgi:hypothetical protein
MQATKLHEDACEKMGADEAAASPGWDVVVVIGGWRPRVGRNAVKAALDARTLFVCGWGPAFQRQRHRKSHGQRCYT